MADKLITGSFKDRFASGVPREVQTKHSSFPDYQRLSASLKEGTMTGLMVALLKPHVLEVESYLCSHKPFVKHLIESS